MSTQLDFEQLPTYELQSIYSAIHCIAWSPNDENLLLTSECNNIIIMTLRGAIKFALNKVPNLQCSGILSDGSYIAISSNYDVLETRDISTGNIQRRLGTYPGTENVYGFTKDGHLWIISKGFCFCQLIDCRTEKKILEIDIRNAGKVIGFAYSTDGRFIATVSDDQNIRIWNVATGKLVQTLHQKNDIHCPTFSPDGKIFAAVIEAQIIRLWEVKTGREIFSSQKYDGKIKFLDFSSSAPFLASLSDGGTIRIFNTFTQTETIGYGNGRYRIRALAFSHCGKKLALGSEGGEVEIITLSDWFLQPKTVVPSPGITDWHLRQIATLGLSQSKATHKDQGLLEVLREMGVDNNHRGFAVSKDGEILYRATQEGHIQALNLITGKQKWRTPAKKEARICNLALSGPAGALLAYATEERTIHFIRTSISTHSGKPTAYPNNIASFALIRESSTSYVSKVVATSDNTIYLAGNPTKSVTHDNSVRCMCVSPDNSLLAFCSGDNTIRLWTTFPLKAREYILKQPSTTNAICFSPDGKILAAGYANGAILLWHLDGKQEQLKFAGHEDTVSCIVFSPDGNRLASAGSGIDKTIRIWDRYSGRELYRYSTHSADCYSLAWPHGKEILVAGLNDGAIYIYDTIPTFIQYSTKKASKNQSEQTPVNKNELQAYSILMAFHYDGADKFLKKGLNSKECFYETVANAKSALNAIQKQDFDLIILDCHVQDINTNEIIKQIRSLDKSKGRFTPIYVLTEVREDDILINGMLAGINQYGSLPFEIDDIRQKVNYWLKRATSHTRQTETTHPISASASLLASWQPLHQTGSVVPLSIHAHSKKILAWASLLASWQTLHQASNAVPLSFISDIHKMLAGDAPPALKTLADHVGVRALQALHWPMQAYGGLQALLLHQVPSPPEWQAPEGYSGPALRQLLQELLVHGVPCQALAPELPLMWLNQALNRVDERMLDLLTALGPQAVAADPGLPLRLQTHVPDMPRISTSQRRLLNTRLPLSDCAIAQRESGGQDRAGFTKQGRLTALLPSQWAYTRELLRWQHQNGALLYRSRAKREVPILRPTVIILDITPATFGFVEAIIRPAAYMLAQSLAEQQRPAILLTAGDDRVFPLDQAAERLQLLIHRCRQLPNYPATIARAQALCRTFCNEPVEPVIVLFTHCWWGDEESFPRRIEGLRSLFVQYPGSMVTPPFSRCCERWASVQQGDDLTAALAHLLT